MPIFRNFEDDPVVPLLEQIRNGINNLGASFASSLGGLGNLNFDFPVFGHTELKSVVLLPDTPTLILPRESVARRNTLKNAQSSTGIIIFVQGIENPGIEDFSKSPWRLSPGSFREDDRDGGYPVWALAVGGAATVEVAIEYAENPNIEEIPMNIEPFFGTGVNWKISDWYLQGLTSLQPDFDSITDGWKFFQFTGFTPGKSYDFQIDAGSLAYDSARAYPINIYLFDIDGLIKSNLFAFFNIHQWGSIVGIEEARKILAILKETSWAARTTALGGPINLIPHHGQYVGLIDIKLSAAPTADTAIFDYTPDPDSTKETGTFSILGV